MTATSDEGSSADGSSNGSCEPADVGGPADAEPDPVWVRAPRQARSQETFDRFVTATADLVDERPFDQVTVADIVRRAERTVGSFYARFDDKYAVLYEVVRRRDEVVRAGVASFCAIERWVGVTLEDFIAEAVRLNVMAYRRSPRVLQTAVYLAASDERFGNLRRASLQFCAEAQKDFLLSRSNEIKRADVPRASDQIFEIMTTTLEHELLFGQFTKSSPESDADVIKDITERCLSILGLSDNDY